MKARGFTMIEMLAVIGMIAILAAVLFPVFAKAREKARACSCLSNLFNIGLALRGYALDHDGWYPPTADDLSPLLPHYLLEKQIFLCPSAFNDIPMGAPANRKLLAASMAATNSPPFTGIPLPPPPPPPPTGPGGAASPTGGPPAAPGPPTGGPGGPPSSALGGPAAPSGAPLPPSAPPVAPTANSGGPSGSAGGSAAPTSGDPAPPPPPGATPKPLPKPKPASLLHTNYYYRAGLRYNVGPRQPLCSDQEPLHNRRANVLFSDGSLGSLDAPRWLALGFKPISEIEQSLRRAGGRPGPGTSPGPVAAPGAGGGGK